jgi:protein-tyrosine phosphatase
VDSAQTGKTAVIDLHSHILPGIDDGAESFASALEIARSAVAEGVTTLAATPHVRSDYPTTPEQMEQLVAELSDTLRAASIPLELLTGGEIALDLLPALEDDALRRFGLGGNPGYLLIELPDFGWPLQIEETLFQLRLRGFRTVLAHPERNSEVQEQPALIGRLVEAGTLVQLTAASLDGRLGPRARKTGTRLLELGLAHMLASDAHAPSVRQIGMSAAIATIADAELANWLTDAIPGAIVGGSQLPARPVRLRRRFGLRRAGGSYSRED